MMIFDSEKSHELDEGIMITISNLVESQKLLKENTEKQEFLVKERKIIYNLLVRVNEERQVICNDYSYYVMNIRCYFRK